MIIYGCVSSHELTQSRLGHFESVSDRDKDGNEKYFGRRGSGGVVEHVEKKEARPLLRLHDALLSPFPHYTPLLLINFDPTY